MLSNIFKLNKFLIAVQIIKAKTYANDISKTVCLFSYHMEYWCTNLSSAQCVTVNLGIPHVATSIVLFLTVFISIATFVHQTVTNCINSTASTQLYRQTNTNSPIKFNV